MTTVQTTDKPKRSRSRAVPPATMSTTPKMPEPEQHALTPEQLAADAAANEQVKADAMAQFVDQQTGAAAPVADQAGFQAELAKLQEKYGVKVDVKVKPAKADKLVRNGITHPAAGTLCAKVWDAADEISKKTHTIAAAAAVREHPLTAGINEATIKTQYARWRQFHGVTGRLPKLQAMHQVQGEYEGLKPMEAASPLPADATDVPEPEKPE